MTQFKPGQPVRTPDGTLATFVKYIGSAYGQADGQAAISVGMDTRLVDAVILKAAS